MEQIAIYRSDDGHVSLSVQFNQETVWLTQTQMVELFSRDKSVISRHIRNIFEEGELRPDATVAKNATVQEEGGRTVNREIDFYSLDVVISVGYRVKSKRGTQFRQWATQVLRQHLVQGYTVHQKRLDELQQTIQLITRQSETGDLSLDEARGLLDVMREFGRSLELLVRYDDQSLDETVANQPEIHSLSEEEALDVVAMLKEDLMLKKQASSLFGNRKDEQFGGILQTINQTFDGYELYPTVEEKAAHLLYFIIKNHPFSDGNKRIGAFLFVWYLELNRHLRKKSGDQKINDNALTALALLVAQSNPSEKELMIKLVINLIIN